MIIEIICVLLLAGFAGFIGNRLAPTNRSKVSFKEALDLTGLPIVTFKQGNTKVNFLLDTGSSKSVILPNLLDVLKHSELNETGTIFGIEGSKIETKFVNINLNYNNIDYSEEFQVVDMSTAFDSLKQETGVTVHGILGGSFFEKYGYVIDYKDYIAYAK